MRGESVQHEAASLNRCQRLGRRHKEWMRQPAGQGVRTRGAAPLSHATTTTCMCTRLHHHHHPCRGCYVCHVLPATHGLSQCHEGQRRSSDVDCRQTHGHASGNNDRRARVAQECNNAQAALLRQTNSRSHASQNHRLARAALMHKHHAHTERGHLAGAQRQARTQQGVLLRRLIFTHHQQRPAMRPCAQAHAMRATGCQPMPLHATAKKLPALLAQHTMR